MIVMLSFSLDYRKINMIVMLSLALFVFCLFNQPFDVIIYIGSIVILSFAYDNRLISIEISE